MQNKTVMVGGFLFPVQVENAPHREIFGEMVLDINHKDLHQAVLTRLVFKRGRMTGNELRYLRHSFALDKERFSRLIQYSVSRIDEWESKGNEPIYMPISVEINLCRTAIDNCLDKQRVVNFYYASNDIHSEGSLHALFEYIKDEFIIRQKEVNESEGMFVLTMKEILMD